MKTKPSLTLELDSHTADAGINTRIEAFLDIIAGYRRLERTSSEDSGFVPAKIVFEKRKPIFVASDGSRHTLDEPSVHLLLPSMGRLSSEGIAAVFDGAGIRTSALPVYDHEALKFGRGNTSCKECLPLILTTGGLLKYLEHRNDPNEHLIYFMPTCGGNCRFTQYNVFLKKFIEKNSLPNIALLSLTNENGYAGLSMPDALNVLKSVIITDCMEDIKNALLVCARDPERAEKVFWEQWERIVDSFRERRGKGIYKILKDIALELSDIPLRIPLSEAKKVALLGEIFVRRDYFSCQDLIKRLAKRDIVVRRAPVLEWLVYCDYNVQNGIYEAQFDMIGALEFKTRLMLQKKYEQKIKKILAGSGLYDFEMIDMDKIIEYGSNLFDVRFTGEAILVVGSFFKEMFHSIQGAISIGPFACMPTRIIEAVLSAESTLEVKNEFDKKQHDNCHMVKNISNLPFLSIETDGNPFPQVLEARVEAFSLQVERLYEKLNKKTQISDSFESAKPLIPN